MIRLAISLWLLFLTGVAESSAQCGSPIAVFSYQEGFEVTNGSWFSGGVGADWAWGAPSKPVITGAGGGTKCWIIGGLTASSYTNAEASWLQSPCFDFTTLQYPYIEFKVFWETEQQFDGGSLQYSIDNGSTWNAVGAANDPVDCLDSNWFNHGSITYLSPLSSTKNGWSGNIQASMGSCRGGSGSNGWKTAKHVMPYLSGKPSVIFRFIFGAGTICNNYDGFAIDDLLIKEAPPNNAAFVYACGSNNIVNFTNTSAFCPNTFSWDFGDPGSGVNNTASTSNPVHTFSAPGTYTVTLMVNGPGNAASTITKSVTVLGLTTSILAPANCLTNDGGSAIVTVSGSGGPFSYSWNTSPVQTNNPATNLSSATYSVTVMAPVVCPTSANVTIPLDLSCIGVYFPSAFTPNNDGLNDLFGPLGSLTLLTNYKFSIYNRWGERVFYSTNPFEKWNGKVRGLTTDGDVFVWYATFSLQGQPVEKRKGIITVIR